LEAKPWDVLVVGAGITGLETAKLLGEMGFDVLLVEKKPQLGGHAALYQCKALDGKCVECGACLVGDAQRKVLSNKKVVPMTGTTILNCQREGNLFKLELVREGVVSFASAKAVILCNGFRPFDPSTQKNLSYGKSNSILTALEVEDILRNNGKLLRPGSHEVPKSICFIQCVGSRNERNIYCSRVCCGYAIRIANLLKSLQPDLDITFFYMDIQTFSRSFVDDWAKIREKFTFIRQIPGELIPNKDGTISIYAKIDGVIKELFYDLVILSCGITPSEDLDQLAQIFKMKKNKDGFLSPSPENGVFALGTATGPKGIADCIAEVRCGLGGVVEYLEAWR